MRPGNFSSVFSYIESMEILMLILLYYLSQNPDFPESVRPLMGQLKNSEEMGEAYLASRTRPQKLLESVCALMTPVL